MLLNAACLISRTNTAPSSYQNEITCAGQLPPQFPTLKQEIANSIAKFNEAYNIAELKGSKLKDLLYGY